MKEHLANFIIVDERALILLPDVWYTWYYYWQLCDGGIMLCCVMHYDELPVDLIVGFISVYRCITLLSVAKRD
jgi:hypothetical protein